ncbi:MAG: flagellar biosynthesis protein FlhF [Phycisphaeraceae bacterium]
MMKLKTVRAPSLQKALNLVRQEVGPDAVVLHTRHAPRRGLLGWLGVQAVEVTAANGRDVALARAKKIKQAPKRPDHTHKAPPIARSAQRQRPAIKQDDWQSPGPTADLIKHAYHAVKHDLQIANPQPTITPLPAEPSALTEEMRQVKAVLARLVQKQAANAPQGVTPSLAGRYMQLIEHEVAEELATTLINKAHQANATADDDEAANRAIRQALAQLLPVGEIETADENTPTTSPKIIALVGPTGVGKTTTLAKLATQFAVQQNKKVTLITIDTYRIAAVDQLRTYADILGLKLEVVQKPEHMTEAVQRNQDADVILIDTAGRSPRDANRIAELARFVHAAKPHQTHLVLACTANQRSMLDTNERFSPLSPTHVIFTKIDEAVSFGTLINVLTTTKHRLSYITTGQEVPHDIEAATPERLADLMLIGQGGKTGC